MTWREKRIYNDCLYLKKAITTYKYMLYYIHIQTLSLIFLHLILQNTRYNNFCELKTTVKMNFEKDGFSKIRTCGYQHLHVGCELLPRFSHACLQQLNNCYLQKLELVLTLLSVYSVAPDSKGTLMTSSLLIRASGFGRNSVGSSWTWVRARLTKAKTNNGNTTQIDIIWN